MQEVAKLLWTGGWDSTYRLLDLLLIKRKTVQPYYLISRGRHSSQLEIRTMDKIRALILRKAPACVQLLLPTIYKEVEQIEENEEITRQFKNLAATRRLGTQYDYLARFANEENLNSLELSVHKDDHAQFFLKPFVIAEGAGTSYRLQSNPSNPDLLLFKNFKFPILDLTKTDMQKVAVKHGFLDIMNQTVFCHTPRANGKPCGVCNPCVYTMKEGLSRRIPFFSRLKFYIKQLIKRRYWLRCG